MATCTATSRGGQLWHRRIEEKLDACLAICTATSWGGHLWRRSIEVALDSGWLRPGLGQETTQSTLVQDWGLGSLQKAPEH